MMVGMIKAFGVLVMAAAVGACGQDAVTAEKAFRDSIVNSRQFLRGLNGDNVVRWRWDGNVLAQEPPKHHSMAIFTVRGMKIKDGKMELTGERRTLLRKPDKKLILSASVDSVRVIVDLAGADSSSLIPKLAGLIFYSNIKDAITDVPAGYQSLLPEKSEPSKSPMQNVSQCDCSHPRAATCGADTANGNMAGAKHPEIASSVEPDFSAQAGALHQLGRASALISLIVTVEGKPDFLWIARTSGIEGYDAVALKTVEQYTFKPATCHGEPVPVDLYVDVTFEIR